MDASRTVFELKSAFIRAQVRILSESLEPPEDWRIYTTESEEDELSDKAVQDALQKLNGALKQHNRIVYSSQAIQHVAQQITSLYWSLVSQATHSVAFSDKRLETTVDLCSHLWVPRYGRLSAHLADISQQHHSIACGIRAPTCK
jgi:hypothetical protein